MKRKLITTILLADGIMCVSSGISEWNMMLLALGCFCIVEYNVIMDEKEE